MVPAMSFTCYLVIVGVVFLLANFIPGVAVVTLVGTALFGAVVAYIGVDHLLSCFNRNPNGDDLFEFHLWNKGPDIVRNSDWDNEEIYTKDSSDVEDLKGYTVKDR